MSNANQMERLAILYSDVQPTAEQEKRFGIQIDSLNDVVCFGVLPGVIGASLGGITSLCVVGENPGVASALVLVDVVVDVEPKGIERIKEFMTAHVDGFDSLDDVADGDADAEVHVAAGRVGEIARLQSRCKKGSRRWRTG